MKTNMPSPQAAVEKGKQMFPDNQFKREMQNSSHSATRRGLKKKHPAQKRYMGQIVQSAKGIAAHKEGKA